jgi:dihydroorotase
MGIAVKLAVALLCCVFSLTVSAQAQPSYDLLLKGGHVIDPKNHIDKVTDIAVAGGKVAQVADNIAAASAKKVIDLKGLYVTPGLIDIHTHLFPRLVLPPGSPPSEGIDPDTVSFRGGVTTMVDAGSTGWKEFPEFKERVVKPSKTRVLAFLNIVGAGMGTGNDNNVAEMTASEAARMALANPGLIVGFKSAHYSGPGWESVDNAVAAGNQAHIPVMVDFGRITETRNIDELFSHHLRPGDIYTHMFSSFREETLRDGTLNPAMEAGRKRGIIFDLGFGSQSFFWFVAVPAYQANFRPDSISSDQHKDNMNEGMKDMPHMMSEIMSLGSSLQDVVEMASWAPAKEIHHPELGNLDVGAEADITVLGMETGHFRFTDSVGAARPGTRRLTSVLTLRKGAVMWDRDGLSAQDWQSFPYRKGPYFKSAAK